jgi:hypothetical protein
MEFFHSREWMDENWMKLWPKRMHLKHLHGLLKNPAPLACDQFRAHVTGAPKRLGLQLNMQLTVMPGGLSSQMQLQLKRSCLKSRPEEWRHLDHYHQQDDRIGHVYHNSHLAEKYAGTFDNKTVVIVYCDVGHLDDSFVLNMSLFFNMIGVHPAYVLKMLVIL